MAARFIYYDIPLTVRVKTPVSNPMAPRRIKMELKDGLLGIDIAGTLGEIQVSSVVEQRPAPQPRALIKELMEIAFDGPSELKVWPKADNFETPQEWKRRVELAGHAYLGE